MTQFGLIAQMTPADAIGYSLTGFSLVLVTLAALWILSMVSAMVIKAAGLNKTATAETSKQGTIDPKTVAVITAAVTFATGGKSSIKDIRKIS
jgi:hypothetical protein